MRSTASIPGPARSAAIGPDGDLWVSNQGFGPTLPGFGEILRIDPN